MRYIHDGPRKIYPWEGIILGWEMIYETSSVLGGVHRQGV